jgi:hypothetical protein
MLVHCVSTVSITTASVGCLISGLYDDKHNRLCRVLTDFSRGS